MTKGKIFLVAQTKYIRAEERTDEKLLETGICNLDEIRNSINIRKQDSTAIEELKAIVEQVWETDDHQLTKKLLERKHDCWIPY